jgi:hypothetical protein
MDYYYQSVVTGYLRADRTTFVNTEYCIQLDAGAVPKPGRHWYCDAVALEFGATPTIFLCEITFAKHLGALMKRLKDWQQGWTDIAAAVKRDSGLCKSGLSIDPVRAWLFVPAESVPLLTRGLKAICPSQQPSFKPRITTLEMVQPWSYRAWDRKGEEQKPESIPPAMRD